MDESPLGKLPAEMQEMIIEYTVVQEKPILLRDKSTLVEIPIAKTCRELRSYSLKIFYEGNNFDFEVIDCNARFLANWSRLYARNYRLKYTNCLFLEGAPDWASAVAWLELHFAEPDILNLTGLSAEGGLEFPLFAVLGRAFMISRRLKIKGLLWPDVKPVVEDALWMSRGTVRWTNAPME